MIYPGDLDGVDEGLARRVIAAARRIAPCINSLEPGEDLDTVIAILVATAAEVPALGSKRVRAERIGPASVDYYDSTSWFSVEDRESLRAMCESARSAGPVGQFPKSGLLSKLWPEIPA